MNIKFIGSYSSTDTLPNTQFYEYAFIGRSNVGKSSLINAIVSQNVARTSNTPGRTQSMNLFNIDDKIILVDLPGYGYSRVSKSVGIMWVNRLQNYLLNRSQLRRLFILIDSRIGIKPADLDLIDFCDNNGICYQIVYTKTDKRIKQTEQIKIVSTEHPAMVDEILETSAEKKTGIESLRNIIGIK